MELVRNEYNPNLKIRGYLFTQYRTNTTDSKESLDLLRKVYNEEVFEAVIPQNTDINKSFMERKDIFSYNPKSPGALAYFKLSKELYHE